MPFRLFVFFFSFFFFFFFLCVCVCARARVCVCVCVFLFSLFCPCGCLGCLIFIGFVRQNSPLEHVCVGVFWFLSCLFGVFTCFPIFCLFFFPMFLLSLYGPISKTSFWEVHKTLLFTPQMALDWSLCCFSLFTFTT